MHFQQTPIQDLYKIISRLLPDETGFIMESGQQMVLAEQGIFAKVKQETRSFTRKGILWNGYFQPGTFAQSQPGLVSSGRVPEAVAPRAGASALEQPATSMADSSKETGMVYLKALLSVLLLRKRACWHINNVIFKPELLLYGRYSFRSKGR